MQRVRDNIHENGADCAGSYTSNLLNYVPLPLNLLWVILALQLPISLHFHEQLFEFYALVPSFAPFVSQSTSRLDWRQ